jgi:ATP-dependent Clp protease ATP-binding subunit ClpA
VQISLDDAAVEWLLEQASRESNSGARPLRRSIQRYIEDELSDFMIRHKDQVPERIEFTVQDGVVILTIPRADLITSGEPSVN